MLFRSHIVLAAVFLLMCSVSGADPSYPRPAFDKAPYRKTVWSTANPWWKPNIAPPHRNYSGGPDYAWHDFPADEDEMWKRVAELYHSYGLTGLQMEVGRYTDTLRSTARGFHASGTGMTVMPFLQALGGPEPEGIAAHLTAMLKSCGPMLREHPGFYRLDGKPVIFIYRANRHSPEVWKKVIPAVEQEVGNLIWLFDGAFVGVPKAKIAGLTREFLETFDGISMYGNWSERTQKELFSIVAPIMHKEFPEKIFEGAVHTSYTNHFTYGGVDPDLTSKYRNSWDITLAADPDSLTVTNWFDLQENSRIMPSYELDDFRLRLLRQRVAQWRGEKPPISPRTEIYVANPIAAQLGKKLDCEVILFPSGDPSREVTFRLVLCNGKGEVLHQFPQTKTTVPELKSFRFSVPSEKFAGEFAVYPRLLWKDDMWRTVYFPQTNLVTGLRPHLLHWVRATEHQLKTTETAPWSLGTASEGETMTYDGKPMLLRAEIVAPREGNRPNTGAFEAKLLRNGRLYKRYWRSDLNFSELLTLPPPNGGADWYHLELRNRDGYLHRTRAIWVVSPERAGEEKLNIRSPRSGSAPNIANVTVKAAQIPFFQYDCDRNDGVFVADSSGFEHHGSLIPQHRQGYLAYTNYRHEHIGHKDNNWKAKAEYIPNRDGFPALYFDGTGYASFLGGTAFPGEFTYELHINFDRDGQAETFLAAGNRQIKLSRDSEGYIIAEHAPPVESSGGEAGPAALRSVRLKSSSRVEKSGWHHIAVTYDLKTMRLYLDGKPEAEGKLDAPSGTEWLNAIIVGGDCRFPYHGVPMLQGAVRNLRFSGKSLPPEQFQILLQK